MMSSTESQVLSLAQRASTLVAGVACISLTNKLFDFVLYPYVIFQAGLVLGAAIMTALSAIVCLLYLLLYDHTQQDWLGIETIRDLKEYRGETRFGHFVAWFLRKGDLAAFFLLSTVYDPFITTVWLRQERFGGLARRDHWIFWGSVVVANGFWAISCWLGINSLQWLWDRII